MRITKKMVEDLAQALRNKLNEHPLYQQILLDRKEVAFQTAHSLDPVAANLTEIAKNLPALVRGQLTKVSQASYSLDAKKYDNLVKALKEHDGVEDMPAYPFNGYSSIYVDFPPGKVLFSNSARNLPELNLESAASRAGWAAIARAEARKGKAEKSISTAVSHLEQLAYEMVTLDQLMANVPVIKDLVPASWLAEPEEESKTKLVDEKTAARLRALILGEPV